MQSPIQLLRRGIKLGAAHLDVGAMIAPPYTEFYCDPVNGSNLNGGSDPNPTALYTSTNGNWDNTNFIFTPTDGTNPATAGVQAGQFASVYIDGASTGVCIRRITQVENAANGRIIVVNNGPGTTPTTSATARSIRVGGAFKGPNGTDPIPLAYNFLNGVDAAGHLTRINMKNNASYVTSSNIVVGSNIYMIQGYANTPGDGGKANIDAGGHGIILWTESFDFIGTRADLIFSNNAGGNDAVSGGSHIMWLRCVWHDISGNAVVSPGSGPMFYECEFYKCNTNNSSNKGCVQSSSFDTLFRRCYFHDCAGTQGHGISVASSSGIRLENCVFSNLGGDGIHVSVTGSGTSILAFNCDFYKCANGIKCTAAVNPIWIYIENTNFVKNAQWGIDRGSATRLYGWMANAGVGTGSMANAAGFVNVSAADSFVYASQQLQGSGYVFYPANATPYADAENGNFTIVLGNAMSAGRGAFTQNEVTSPTTWNYIDIGAVQSTKVVGSNMSFSGGA
jgi:Right handed beta helix region